ncbi:MAG: extracellular solute-binding protein [Rhodospirillales bacterium]|nr:extracellular solute-binding protein [Rhodospirillales bacterium]
MPARLLMVTAAMLLAWTAAASARDLTVVARGETMTRAMREVFTNAFAQATGLPVDVQTWEGGLDPLRDRLKAPDTNTWDLVQVDADELATGCGEGLFEKLDWSAIGGKDHYASQAVSDCGVGAALSATILAWDKDKFQTTPSWADFWDVAKYPGKRGLMRSVRGNLEIALLADGVAPADVYKTLATADGVDRAFRKLDQLRPYLVWWQTDTDAARILGSGDVLMTSAPAGAITTAMRAEPRNFGIQWAQGLYEMTSWAVLKGSPNARLAQQFLYFAGTAPIEARLVRAAGVSGLAKGTQDSLAPELQAINPANPSYTGTALRLDTGFWHDNLAKLRARFDAWLAVH